MFEKELETLQTVYDQLNDRFDLVLTNAFAVDEDGYEEDYPIIEGKAHVQIVRLYMIGEEFILDVMDEAQTKVTHWHPLDAETAVEDLAEFMAGKDDYQLWPFPAYR